MEKIVYYNKGFNFLLVCKLLGGLVLAESFFLMLCVAVAEYYDETTAAAFIVSAVIAALLGISGLFFGRKANMFIGKREGSIIVTLAWIVFSLVGLLPYWISKGIPSFTDAFFETISGFTTTGASILQNVEILPKSLLFWRSMTHWIGGLGIVIITMAVLPIFGFTGTQLYSAEATGISNEKIHPKMSGTARRLLAIYLIFTVLESSLLWLAGMSKFDAVCNTFATVSTGGFSTRNASIAYWQSPAIEWIIFTFMIMSSINFSLYYFLVKGKLKSFFKDEEMNTFVVIVLVASVITALSLLDFHSISLEGINNVFRKSAFTVASIISTTGFVSVDYSSWTKVAFMFMLLSFIGGSAGSTSGGLKVIRISLVFKYCHYELKRMVHPNAIFPVRFNGRTVKEEVITKMLAFLLMFIIITLLGAAVLGIAGMGFEESISGMISLLSNVGPGLGRLGPIENYAAISDFCKWFLSITMLVGRLELFTVLLIFSPVFWRK